MSGEILKGLNPEQTEAALHVEGPLLVLAGAGSGKTTVLVSRCGRLINELGVLPAQICVLTFTNKAARELKHRVAHRIGEQAKGLWAGTFHSFGLRLLKENHRLVGLSNHFGVLDSSDSQAVLKELVRDLKVPGKDKFDMDRLLQLVHTLKSGKRLPQGINDPYHDLAEMIVPKYQKRLQHLGAVDFDDLLLKPAQLFREHPEVLKKYQEKFRFMMVDEFQDTNEMQMVLIDQMVKLHRNLMVVGDDDQAIYGWRGAEVKHILDFPKQYKPCKVIRLERNYRSSPHIVSLANQVIGENTHRHGKVLTPQSHLQLTNRPEIFVFESENEEADFVQSEIRQLINQGNQYSDIAILYRSNSQGGVLESVFRQNQWPYGISGGTGLFDRKEVKDVMAYLRLSLGPMDLAARRVVNLPSRGIGETTLDKIDEQARINGKSFWESLLNFPQGQIPERASQGIAQFQSHINELRQKLFGAAGANSTGSNSMGANLLKFLDEIGYRQLVYQSGSTSDAGEKKWISVEILSKILDRFQEKGGANQKTVQEFVEAMELKDNPDDEDSNRLSLMTLHASKGLEFPHVMLLGVEEDLLPHRTLGSDVSEERRLFYVGITRAQKHLILTRCRSRMRHGSLKPCSPSRFLMKLPKELLIEHPMGVRPVTESQRESLLSGFLASLDEKSAKAARPKGLS